MKNLPHNIMMIVAGLLGLEGGGRCEIKEMELMHGNLTRAKDGGEVARRYISLVQLRR